jgi:RND family efflux transporter MFP subunit
MQRNPRARWKLILAVVLPAAAAALIGWQVVVRVRAGRAPAPGAAGNAAQSRSAAVAVEVASVERSDVHRIEEFIGSLASPSRVTVSAKVGGRLERFMVRVGDRLERGALVAELDPEEYRQQVEQAEAELEVAAAGLDGARIALEAAQRDLERVKVLRQEKVAAEAELDLADTQRRKAQSQLAMAEAQLRQKQVALEVANLHLEQTRVRASWPPGQGRRVVGERFAEPGSLVKAGDPLLTVLQLDPLEAVIQVVEQTYTRLRAGQQARVTADVFPGAVFEGTVTTVAPFLEESTRQAEVRIEVGNPEGTLKPGMVVRVAIEMGRRLDALTVPVAAVTEYRGQRGVFQLEADSRKVRFVALRLGIQDGNRVEVLEPSLSGMVVVLGQHLLADGAAVIPSQARQP